MTEVLYAPIELSDRVHVPCSNSHLSFDIVPIQHKEDEDYFPDPELELLDTSKVDYCFTEDNIPLSFLSITNKEEGEAWYRVNTKVPECMIPYLARYHWGDLHPKYPPFYEEAKKKKKNAKPQRKFEKNNGKFVVNFD
eukprot:SAG22_NODE_424_length_10663_cov_93.402026_15_plen_138_part_00